jgi:hypothetical protein
MYAAYKEYPSYTTKVSKGVTVTPSAVTSKYKRSPGGALPSPPSAFSLPLSFPHPKHAMATERAERWENLDLKPKRWWGYTIFLFILGTLLPPLGKYCSDDASGLSLTLSCSCCSKIWHRKGFLDQSRLDLVWLYPRYAYLVTLIGIF